jgi:arylsulfatase
MAAVRQVQAACRGLVGILVAGLLTSCADSGGADPSPGPTDQNGAAAADEGEASRWIDLRALIEGPPRAISPSLISTGFQLRGGGTQAIDVSVGFQASLRFTIALRPGDGEDENQLVRTLQVSWDGRPLPIGELPTSSRVATLHDLPLPRTSEGDNSTHRLVFSMPEGPGWTVVHGPAIRPTRMPARIPDPERPDVILFVADTFRADDLDHPGLTPHLNAFAEHARSYTQARSPSTWTLPAVASLLFGVHPGQHGGVHLSLQPSSPAATLAETLAAAGYRTAAVTDSAFVSRRYGLDRGFEWFQELHEGSLEGTLAVAEQLLDADDGRPLLLMVHSYHTHGPYTPRAATAALLEQELGIPQSSATYEELETEALALALGEQTSEASARTLELTTELANLRLATVHELDAAFGRLLDLAHIRGMGDNAVVVFTSDHGEAFNEHGFLFHGRSNFDEVLRIPLLVRAPGVVARRHDEPVSLVDVAPTISELLGLPGDALWSGFSLLTPDRERSVFSFNWSDAESVPIVSVVRSQLKLIASADVAQLAMGLYVSAYDLELDPGEQEDISAARSDRLQSWARDLVPRVRELLTPFDQAEAVLLDDQHMELLRQLGYVGDDQR